jgi:hypothetical protein
VLLNLKPHFLFSPDDPPSGGAVPPETPPGSPPATPPPAEETPGEEEEFDKDRALATIRKQRESEKTLAAQVKQMQADLKAYQDKENAEKEKALTEQQKLEKKLAESAARLEKLEAENTRLITFNTFTRTAKELGFIFVNPQAEVDAFAFVTGVKVEEDKVIGMEDAVKALQKSRPYFFTGNGDGLPGTPPRGKRPTGQQPGKVEPVKINF